MQLPLSLLKTFQGHPMCYCMLIRVKFRYGVFGGVNVVGFAYSVLQGCDLVYQLATGSHGTRRHYLRLRAVITNGIFKSSEHRVVTSSKESRYKRRGRRSCYCQRVFGAALREKRHRVWAGRRNVSRRLVSRFERRNVRRRGVTVGTTFTGRGVGYSYAATRNNGEGSTFVHNEGEKSVLGFAHSDASSL
ncbi:hypothetical protein Tco_0715099 [Tanacetum coccineum]